MVIQHIQKWLICRPLRFILGVETLNLHKEYDATLECNVENVIIGVTSSHPIMLSNYSMKSVTNVTSLGITVPLTQCFLLSGDSMTIKVSRGSQNIKLPLPLAFISQLAYPDVSENVWY